MRHFSIANLNRLASVHGRIAAKLKSLCPSGRRIVGPVPESVGLTLMDVITILFQPDADHHRRKDGKPSVRIKGLLKLASILNGTLWGKGG